MIALLHEHATPCQLLGELQATLGVLLLEQPVGGLGLVGVPVPQGSLGGGMQAVVGQFRLWPASRNIQKQPHRLPIVPSPQLTVGGMEQQAVGQFLRLVPFELFQQHLAGAGVISGRLVTQPGPVRCRAVQFGVGLTRGVEVGDGRVVVLKVIAGEAFVQVGQRHESVLRKLLDDGTKRLCRLCMLSLLEQPGADVELSLCGTAGAGSSGQIAILGECIVVAPQPRVGAPVRTGFRRPAGPLQTA